MTVPQETVSLFLLDQGKQNSLFPLGPVIKCLLMTHAHFMGCHTGDVFVQLIVRKQNCETGARNIAGPGCSKAG